jgi:aldose sugar dehydrogenase
MTEEKTKLLSPRRGFRMVSRLLYFILSLIIVLAVWWQFSYSVGETNAIPVSISQGFRIETVVTRLRVPWSMVFTPDKRILLTERPGRLRVIEGGKLRNEPLFTISDVESSGELGLMGLTLHPNFSENRLLYLAYAYMNQEKLVRVIRYRETNQTLIEPKVIIENIPAARNHAGCRLRFGPDGKLYITTGDAMDKKKSQRLDLLNGKTLRLNDDGTIPEDNPFVGRAKARPEIWSYGHRNSQGLDWQPDTGLMFQTEHGPSMVDGFSFIFRNGGGDEINIVEKGKNYGWPIIHHKQTKLGMETPILEYTPAVAPAGCMFYRGPMFPEFKNNFFFTCLRGRSIIRVTFNGKRIVSQERLFENQYGRIRDIAEGPDGAIYFSTSNRDGRSDPTKEDDRILRIVKR